MRGTGDTTELGRRLRMGMVGGGRGSLIGSVHVKAATMDGGVQFVAGALSSTPDRSRLSAQDYYLPASRAYGTWQEMLDRESRLPEDERVDFCTIVTPNHLHYPIARAFVDAGFHVVLDKPMVHTTAQANDLVAAVEKAGTVFAVTYTYTGYPMVKQARDMVRAGVLGEVRKVLVEYSQGWLSSALEATGHKQAAWRTDPALSGPAGALGDIGTHAENLLHTITGLEIAELCADVSTLVPGRRLDDDANVLLRLANGARGVLVASQISTGSVNNLNIRVFGTEGGLAWRQEDPHYLTHMPAAGPVQILSPGSQDLCAAARRATRLPGGHPEAFFEALANIYRNATDTMRARLLGRQPDDLELDFPSVHDGARGVFFVERVLENSRGPARWTPAVWRPA